MPDILADLKADPRYQQLSVGDQLDAASAVLQKRLVQDQRFLQLDPTEQERVKNLLLAQAPTFRNPGNDLKFKQAGYGYIKNDQSDINSKNGFQFVQGMIRGSGIANGIRSLIEPGEGQEEDSTRAYEYYKALDRMQNKPSGWATAGEMIGATAEMAAITIAMSPVTAALKGSIATAARGGAALAKTAQAAKAAGTVAKTTGLATRASMPLLHPMLDVVGREFSEAITTAIPLYLADELNRAAEGRPSVVSQGAGEVLQTLGENAAGNFLWGVVFGGGLLATARFGKMIFNMKPSDMAQTLVRTVKENDAMLDVLDRKSVV